MFSADFKASEERNRNGDHRRGTLTSWTHLLRC